MNVILEVLWLVLRFFYFLLEAVVKTCVPSQYQRKDVKGERVLITGAGSGLGRLMSLRFAELGCSLVLWDINSESNDQTAKWCRDRGAKVNTYAVDLGNREKIYEASNKVKSEVGDIDILVNNAGIVTGRNFLQCPDALMQKTMEVNVNAHFWTVKSFLPSMMARDHGHIVSIASSAGLCGVSGLADYCASKFAAVGFDESMRMELDKLGKTGVHTTVVCPGFINTGMFEGARMRFDWFCPVLEPEYVADKIVDAVLCNQHMLYLPRIIYFLAGLKSYLPVKCTALLNNFFGISNAMDAFSGGRSKQH